MTMTINDNYLKVAENDTHDFYITSSKWGGGWYVFATRKGNHPANPKNRVLAAQRTKKAAIATAEHWATWMK